MDINHAPASGSKRKREAPDDTIYDVRNGRLEAADPNAHTPKRSRSNLRQSDTDASDSATPANQRSLRRKKKVGNLSNLNLRHAAEQQGNIIPRDSKFQEGSLTDKPSALPPSVFRRMIRTESGNIRQVDELMNEYHEDLGDSRGSVEAAIDNEKALISQRVNGITAETARKDESAGFFSFGRSFAANFHPVSLWNKLWNETKEEMTRQNMEEAERKRRQKEEAEARYAQMKQAGQLGLQSVANVSTTLQLADRTETPRDSAVVIDSARASMDHERPASNGSQLLGPPKDDVFELTGSEVPETASKTKTLKGRFHFKRPSMSDLKIGLKRVKSDMNLVQGANRESSSSLSPVKTEFENPTLRKSHSRYDLKKQSKLSKRVSDLESKLSLARQELNEALVEASPMPKLSNKYERFTPAPTIKRPKFVPGRLPTLPSESLLNPEQLVFGDDEQSPDKSKTEVAPRHALNNSTSLSEMNNTDTIKASSERERERERSWDPRASSLFVFDNTSIQQELLSTASAPPSDNNINETSELTQFTSDVTDMDPNSIANFTSDGAAQPTSSGDYASLDAKLKALDANVKVARKSTKPKSNKRKSGAKDDDKAFNPGEIDDEDDDEWQEANKTPKKKRKSIKGTALTSSAAHGKKPVNGAAKKTGKGLSNKKIKTTVIENVNDDQEQFSEDETKDADPGALADELAETNARTSIDSLGLPLEPLYEEEEETSIVALKDEPSKPTAKATPARHGRQAVRSRSTSPNKQSDSVKPAVEEEMFTRAAAAAQGRRIGGRAASPNTNGHSSKVVEVVNETLTVVPGEGDVPDLPKTAHAGFESSEEKVKVGAEEVVTVVEDDKKRKSNFEWPEDVF